MTTHFTNVFTVTNLTTDCTVINSKVCVTYLIFGEIAIIDKSQKVNTYNELWNKKYAAYIQIETSKTNIGVKVLFGNITWKPVFSLIFVAFYLLDAV